MMSSRTGDRLFVYGTLRRGFSNKFARLLQVRSRFLGDGRIQARLYQFPRYPGAVPSDESDQWVAGELYQLKNPSILPILDRYEGHEFLREVTRVELDTGYWLSSWVYFYRRHDIFY